MGTRLTHEEERKVQDEKFARDYEAHLIMMSEEPCATRYIDDNGVVVFGPGCFRGGKIVNGQYVGGKFVPLDEMFPFPKRVC